MEFIVYQVYEEVEYEGREEVLREYLFRTGIFEGDHGLRYLINNDVEFERGVLTGSISEEYIPDSFSVDDEKNLIAMDGMEPYERTVFVYDFSTRAFLVQNRKYSPNNLKPGKTLSRLKEIFSDAFSEIFSKDFIIIPVLLPEGNDLFINLFTSHQVVELKVLELSKRNFINEEISTEKEESDAMRKIWNEDNSSMDMIHIKTTKGGDLNNNIVAFAALNSPNAVIDRVRYFDPEEEVFVTKTRSSFNKFNVSGVDKNTESITAYEAIREEIGNRRTILRRMRQIRDDE